MVRGKKLPMNKFTNHLPKWQLLRAGKENDCRALRVTSNFEVTTSNLVTRASSSAQCPPSNPSSDSPNNNGIEAKLEIDFNVIIMNSQFKIIRIKCLLNCKT